MGWIDMHCDTLSEIRKAGQGRKQEKKGSLLRNELCVDIESLGKAGAEAQFFACFVNAADYGAQGGAGKEKKMWQGNRSLLEKKYGTGLMMKCCECLTARGKRCARASISRGMRRIYQ